MSYEDELEDVIVNGVRQEAKGFYLALAKLSASVSCLSVVF